MQNYIQQTFEPDMFVLNKDDSWTKVNFSDARRQNTYRGVKDVLDENQGKGVGATTDIILIEHDQIRTRILKISSHRFGTVAYCEQYDSTTRGLRYIVYGTRYNEDIGKDHGIGLGLDSVDTKNAMEFCPKHVSAHFL